MPTDHSKHKPKIDKQYVLTQDGLPLLDADNPPTVERRAFLDGLLQELNHQMGRYIGLVGESARIQAQMTIVERNLQLTRDHLKVVLSNSEDEVPPDWEKTLHKIRFVGTRLGDACVQVLRENQRLTRQEMLRELNRGQFRFRTGSPLREINAALLRQPYITKDGDYWVYKNTKDTHAQEEEVKIEA